MPTNFDRESAQIYAFPMKGRTSSAAERTGPEPAPLPASAAVSKSRFGDGWYHDAAIADADLTRRR